MRRQGSVICVLLMLVSGCSATQSSSEPSSIAQVNIDAVKSATPSLQASSSTIKQSITADSASPKVITPQRDAYGQPLTGVPDCNWAQLDLTPRGQRNIEENSGELNGMRETSYVAMNFGQPCVIRELPQVTLLDPAKNIMSPTFTSTKPDKELPWLLPNNFGVRFYYESLSVSNAAMCPETADYVRYFQFAFNDGTIRQDEITEGLYACPNITPYVKTNMRANPTSITSILIRDLYNYSPTMVLGSLS